MATKYQPINETEVQDTETSSYRALPDTTKPPAQEHATETHRIGLKEWLRLLVVWICCSLAAGIIPGQAVFSQMFADAGVYSDLCHKHDKRCGAQLAQINMLLGIGIALVMAVMLPVGLLFDIYGGRIIGTAGSFLVAVGICCMSMLVYSARIGEGSMTNWMLLIFSMITDFGSVLNSYCFFGLIWHYPGSTTVILSLSTATYQISALLPLLLQALMDRTGITLDAALLVYASLVLASAIVIWQVTPTQQDYYDRAKEVLGVPLPKPKKSLDLCGKLYKGLVALIADARDHAWLCMGFAFSSTFAGMYTSMSSGYGKDLFGSSKDGTELAHLQVKVTAAVGMICAPFVAKIADFLGLQRFAWLLTCFVVVPAGCFYVKKWWAAWLTTCGLCLFSTLNQLFMNRYLLHYAPPNRLGVYSGVFTVFVTLIMMPVASILYMWIMMNGGRGQYFLPFLVAGVLGVFTLLGFNIRFCFAHDGNGVPKVPFMLPEDEMELASFCGAMNLDEAAEIVGLPKEEVIKRLANPDPLALKALMCLIDADRMDVVLARHGADDMIAMLEAQPEAEDEPEGDEPDAGDTVIKMEQASSTAQPLVTSEPLDVSAGGQTSDVGGAAGDSAAATVQDSKTVLVLKLRGLFQPGSDAQERKDVLAGKQQEPDEQLRWRALGECLDNMVSERDAEGCKMFLLEVPVEDQWHCFVSMEEWMEEKRSTDMEKKFNKLVPPKVFAGLVRQNPELKDLVKRLMKRGIQKSVKRFRGK